MNRGKIKTGVVFILVTVLLGITLATLVLRVINTYKDEAEVVVTTTELGQYVTILREHVTLAKVPAITLKGDSLRKIEDVVGSISKTSILPGEALRKGHLLESEIAAGSLLTTRLSALDSAELRAITIPIDPFNAIGGNEKLQRGDTVDIVAVFGEEDNTTTKLFIHQAPVLELFKDENGEGGAIIAIPYSQVEEVALMLASGRWILVLNPINSEAQESTTGMDRDYFDEKYGVRKKP